MLFNGEIYNYKELLNNIVLKDEDYSDTDLLFKLINKVGFKCDKKIKGNVCNSLLWFRK